jgi:hypothetical protein
MKKSLNIYILGILLTFFASCVGDDFIMDFQEPEVRITTLLDTLEINTTFQFESLYLNHVGIEEVLPTIWQSSDETIATISDQGLVTAIAVGNVIIEARVDNGSAIITDAKELTVGMTTVLDNTGLSGSAQTTSSYKLEGDFKLLELDNGNLNLSFDESYCASSALPGLYIYLSNNRNSIADALEISEVTIFSGAHDYEIENAELMEYSFIVYFCKPFNVKVGDGEIN